jgi:hypothetical protein
MIRTYDREWRYIGGNTYRRDIPGGWLVICDGQLVVVSDPNDEWLVLDAPSVTTEIPEVVKGNSKGDIVIPYWAPHDPNPIDACDFPCCMTHAEYKLMNAKYGTCFYCSEHVMGYAIQKRPSSRD